MRNFILIPLLAIALFLSRAEAQTAHSCAVEGRVIDAETGEGVGWSEISLIEIERGTVAHPDGEFHLYNLPSGVFTLRVVRIGYAEWTQTVRLRRGDTLRLDLRLSKRAVEIGGIQIETDRDSILHGERNDVAVSGAQLQQNLTSTVAGTLQNQPGISQRTMGSASARPVLRGLGGDRLLILEDGQRTGDLSATSADHAVAIDPATAENIAVIRGPRTILYGSSVMGGVVDVERGAIVRSDPHRVSGEVTLAAETASELRSGGLMLTAPAGPVAIRADGNILKSDNTRSPSGIQKNTQHSYTNGSLGVSLIRTWGIAGIAGNFYDAVYGIPGGFVGAHSNGVDIELLRRHFQAQTMLYTSKAWLQKIEIEYDFSWYHHRELEASGNVGIEFGVLTDNAGAKFHLGEHGPFSDGVMGISTERRNYATGGFSSAPDSKEQAEAIFIYETLPLGSFSLLSSLRADYRDVTPEQEKISIVIGHVRKRNFFGISGALALEKQIRDVRAGISFQRSFRPPAIEELFSEGPHLAAYSYEIGNPNLGAETGLGTELYTKLDTHPFQINSALFYNHFDAYIFPRNTGQFSPRRADLIEYRYEGQNAELYGGEISTDYSFATAWTLSGSLSIVYGNVTDSDTPLPMIPPPEGHIGLLWKPEPWTFEARVIGAADQNRTAEFEESTAAFLRFDFSSHAHFEFGRMLFSVAGTLENIADTDYRRHLSRIKSILPEAGRNCKLSLHTYF